MRNFRVDTLKIDRTFIREIPSNPEDRAIADAILSIGQSLSIDVVAEGVETLDQLRYLRSSSCDQLQGWYFSKALPPDDLARLWKSGEHIGANHLRQLPSDPMAPGAGVETDGSLRLSD
jgi:EAL domain-containing protein (putative c-di-GMP-specific phosphodiesterase class I)